MANPEPIRVGDIVHGYLFGYFGRDHYDCSRVEAVGTDWAVVRHLNDGMPCAGTGPGILTELLRSRDPKVTEIHSCGFDGHGT